MARMRDNGFKLHQGKVSLDIRKRFFSERVLMRWHGAVVESLSLEVFMNSGDMVLRDTVGMDWGWT